MINKMNLKKYCFAMTEIIAVAAIISSIPTSSYTRVKQKTYQLQCTNNLRQIGQFFAMYLLEHGKYPEASFFPKNPKKNPKSIRNILGGPDALWMCPSLPTSLREQGSTYIYNEDLAGKSSSLSNSSKRWVLIEMNCVAKKSPYPHPRGYNILFADGHILCTKRLPRKITDAHSSQ